MKRLSGPVDVQLELTESCNFRCRHCYNYWRYDTKSDKQELNSTDFLRVIDTLAKYGVSAITLTGGEPLLRPGVLFPTLRKAKEYGMEIGLNTNASLVTSDAAQQLKDEGLDHVLCSILGKEETHNFITGTKSGFPQTLKGIEKLVKAGILVATNMVVSKLNLSEVFEVGKLVNNLGVKTFCATPMVPSHESNLPFVLSGEECKSALRNLLLVEQTFRISVDTLEPIARCLFNENDEDDFLSFFGNRICSAATTSCAISSTGMVRPCIHADKSFGNVFQEDFSAIWTNMSPWSEESMLPTECINCSATTICEGGCRMSSKTTNGSYNGKDMYMSLPIFNPKRVAKLPNRKKQFGKILLEERVEINSLTRLREESFGGIAYVGTSVQFLTHDGFQLVRLMVQKRTFSSAEITEETGLDASDIIEVVLTLFNSGVILK